MKFCGRTKKENKFAKNVIIFAFFAIFFAFLVSFLPNLSVFADEVSDVFVVTANSAVVFEEASFSSNKITTLKNQDEILLVMDGQSPQVFESEGWEFFKIATTFETESGAKQGFILSDLVTPKTDVIVAIPHFNAKTNIRCNVFFLENEKYVKQENLVLEKGTQIFLYEGFESKSTFTAICFVRDNQVIYGYLESKNINPNGINPIIITCACVILAVLGIIFAWLFMKNKKTKKMKNKTKMKIKLKETKD